MFFELLSRCATKGPKNCSADEADRAPEEGTNKKIEASGSVAVGSFFDVPIVTDSKIESQPFEAFKGKTVSFVKLVRQGLLSLCRHGIGALLVNFSAWVLFDLDFTLLDILSCIFVMLSSLVGLSAVRQSVSNSEANTLGSSRMFSILDRPQKHEE